MHIFFNFSWVILSGELLENFNGILKDSKTNTINVLCFYLLVNETSTGVWLDDHMKKSNSVVCNLVNQAFNSSPCYLFSMKCMCRCNNVYLDVWLLVQNYDTCHWFCVWRPFNSIYWHRRSFFCWEQNELSGPLNMYVRLRETDRIMLS